MKISRLSSVILLCLGPLCAIAQDGTVVVMTSYPQELISRYEAAFEATYPAIDMRLEWRRSDDAWQLLQTSAAPGVDVYWSPSIDTFAAMATAGYFIPLGLPRAGLAGRIGDLLIDDPAGRYAAFEVAGFGFAYSQAYLDANQLPVPQDWHDLSDPRYAGAILMPVPSRQGFSPLIYESILQSSGWEKGWSLITAIAANSELMGTGGMSFIDALQDGSRGLALTIDFFPKSAQANGTPVDFRYADTSLFSPAHVAIMKAAPNPDAARTFTDFVLSDAGQTLLLHRDVSRLPARPSAYHDSAVYNPFTGAVTVPAYDFDLGGARKQLLSALFDVQVTARHEALLAAMSLLRKAEKLAGQDTAAAARLAHANALLTAPAVGTAEADVLLAVLTENGTPAATPAEGITTSALPVAAWTQILAQRTMEATAIANAIIASHQ